jgi:pyridoxamine 5'-phosphate oxidase
MNACGTKASAVPSDCSRTLVNRHCYRAPGGRAKLGRRGIIRRMASNHDPIAKLIRWLNDAKELNIPNYEAMALATTDGSEVSVRFVLLKKIDQHGLVFFTDARSRKGHQLQANPHASLAFYWEPNGRQVRADGDVEQVEAAEADAYWVTRPRQSRLAASVSHQSARLRSRAELMARMERLAKRSRGQEIARPPYWTGFRVCPHTIEFWRHRAHRLHEREIYHRYRNGWRRYLLEP